MPKRIIGLTLAVAAFALAACASNNGLISQPAPTATPPTPAPNPSITAAVVSVTVSASPLPNQPVAISTPDATGHAGTAFATQLTDSTGTTTFTNLTGAATYCFSTTYVPPSPTLTQTQANCTAYWGSGIRFSF